VLVVSLLGSITSTVFKFHGGQYIFPLGASTAEAHLLVEDDSEPKVDATLVLVFIFKIVKALNGAQ
jgi:hypothetical protein